MRVIDHKETHSRTVAAHDARNASLDGAHEGMDVDLVFCPIVHIGRLLEAEVFLLAASHPKVSHLSEIIEAWTTYLLI